MKNKNVGLLVIGIAIVTLIVVLFFSNTMKTYVNTTCPLVHEESDVCPAKTTIRQQTFMAVGVVGVLFIIGLFLFFSKPEERVVVRKVKEKKAAKNIDMSNLRPEDKKILNIIKSNKAVFQADLVEKTDYGKTKVTRILNRLEDKGLIERKRRGLTNVVVIREN